MPKTPLNKRSRLIRTAAKLAYQNGFNNTSLADIALVAEVPLGNVYYYFKTKEELGEAVIEERLLKQQQAFQNYKSAGSAKEQLCAFVDKAVERKESITCNGCPIGTLSSELQKDGGPLGEMAARMFDEMLDWVQAQFRELGEADCRGSAVHFVASLQGATVLANSLKRADVIVTESERLKKWIRGL